MHGKPRLANTCCQCGRTIARIDNMSFFSQSRLSAGCISAGMLTGRQLQKNLHCSSFNASVVCRAVFSNNQARHVAKDFSLTPTASSAHAILRLSNADGTTVRSVGLRSPAGQACLV
eukprot:365424-Chlamydomonas_euryale.AAC.22